MQEMYIVICMASIVICSCGPACYYTYKAFCGKTIRREDLQNNFL